MYQYTYGEILADSPVDARNQERAVLDHAIRLLRTAADDEQNARAVHEALSFTTQMWSLFINDLAHPGNDLPPELKARLMSIGLWVMAEACRIEKGESQGFAAMADICGLIRDGLN
jgi:flagellar protein FlaF